MMHKSAIIKMLPFYLLFLILCTAISTGGSKVLTVMIECTPCIDRSNIVLDAGHGGIDGGALSCTGVPESLINLQITQKLNDLLNFLGYDTIMLRTSDTSLHTQGTSIAAQKVSDLKQRVKLVNEHSPVLMVSIHQNTFSDGRYSGAQVFHCADPDSKNLALQLQSNFIQALNKSSIRKPKQAKGIYLMEHITCPGILIECGFLTNENEEALLRSEDYQKKLCAVIATTINSWISNQTVRWQGDPSLTATVNY